MGNGTSLGNLVGEVVLEPELDDPSERLRSNVFLISDTETFEFFRAGKGGIFGGKSGLRPEELAYCPGSLEQLELTSETFPSEEAPSKEEESVDDRLRLVKFLIFFPALLSVALASSAFDL